MRADKPLWLLVGSVSVVAERVASADPATEEVAPITGTHVVVASLASCGEELERRSRTWASR
jgi:hypothetical protein